MGARLLGCESAQLSADAEAAIAQRRARIESRLIAAAHCNDLRLLENACDEAEVAGVSLEQVNTMRKKIRRLRAEARLDATHGQANVDMMESACIEGEEAGADASRVARVRSSIAKVRAKTKLECAIQGGLADSIEEACIEATIVGVDSNVIQDGRNLLLRLQAEAKLEIAAQSKDAAVAEEAYKMAVIADLDKTQIVAARKQFECISAESKLHIAQSGTDVEAMKTAVRKAEAAGVDRNKIAVVRDKAERTLVSAEELMETSMHSNDAVEIMQAWEMAVKAGIIDDRAACLRRRAKQITEERLEFVLNCGFVEDMERVCKDVEAISPLHAGIDARLVDAVRRKSRRLRASSEVIELRRSASLILPSSCC